MPHLFPRRNAPIDRAARDHAVEAIGALREGEISWDQITDRLGTYSGDDRGVEAVLEFIHETATDAASHSNEVDIDPAAPIAPYLKRCERFLRSDAAYRWDDHAPFEFVGGSLGLCALSWVAVAGMGAAFGADTLVVMIGALLALLLTALLALAMAFAIIRRMLWRLAAKREGADRVMWPFFTRAEYAAAGPD